MAAWGFIGLSLYILLKRSPTRSRELMIHLNKFIQYMPIDKQAKHLFNPVFNMTNNEIEYYNQEDIQITHLQMDVQNAVLVKLKKNMLQLVKTGYVENVTLNYLHGLE